MLLLLRRLALWFAIAGGLAASAVALLVVVSVVGRAITSSPIQGDVELTQFGTAPTAVRQASSPTIAANSSAPNASSTPRVRSRACWVKKSTMMLLPCSWAHGRHSAMASAVPNCVSSTSPWIGNDVMARPVTLVTTSSATMLAASPPAMANQRASRRSRSGIA